MKEFSVTLANQPGQIATLARRLSDAGAHFESFASIATDGKSLVRFLPDDADVARRVLRDAGIPFEERPVLDTFLPREAGALVVWKLCCAHRGSIFKAPLREAVEGRALGCEGPRAIGGRAVAANLHLGSDRCDRSDGNDRLGLGR